MKTLAFSGLLLISSFAVFAQKPEPAENAPPAVDEALRARVNQFYGAFIAGKFKEAYLLVADDSQDKFFEMGKDGYKSCEIVKIDYVENFTKAAVVTGCKREWHFHGASALSTFPLSSNWEVVDGQWYWHYVKPTQIASPFSPTGFIPVPPNSDAKNVSLIPSNIAGTVQGILAKVSVDKSSVRLLPNRPSRDVVTVRNDMPGVVSLKLEKPDIRGLTVSLAKANLQAREQTSIVFEWQPSNSTIAKTGNAPPVIQLQVEPTNQVFPISVIFETDSQRNQPASPQK